MSIFCSRGTPPRPTQSFSNPSLPARSADAAMADKDAQLAAARQEAAVALEALRRMEVGVRESAKVGAAMESEKGKAAGELKEVPSSSTALRDFTLRFRAKIEQLQTFKGFYLMPRPGFGHVCFTCAIHARQRFGT